MLTREMTQGLGWLGWVFVRLVGLLSVVCWLGVSKISSLAELLEVSVEHYPSLHPSVMMLSVYFSKHRTEAFGLGRRHEEL